MSTLKFYKPDGREIEVNDKGNAAEKMLRDGWRLEPFKQDKPKPKRTTRKKATKDV